jgi:hypothetical protein
LTSVEEQQRSDDGLPSKRRRRGRRSKDQCQMLQTNVRRRSEHRMEGEEEGESSVELSLVPMRSWRLRERRERRRRRRRKREEGSIVQVRKRQRGSGVEHSLSPQEGSLERRESRDSH